MLFESANKIAVLMWQDKIFEMIRPQIDFLQNDWTVGELACAKETFVNNNPAAPFGGAYN